MRNVCVLGVVLVFAINASATLISYEGFDYADIKSDGIVLRATAGTPAANGGSGWAGAWPDTANDVFRTNGLTHPGLITAGGSLQTASFASTGSSRELEVELGEVDSTVWVSFVIRKSAADTAGTNGFAGLSLCIGADVAERMFMGKRNNFGFWGVERAGVSPAQRADTTVSIETQVLFLVKMQFGDTQVQVDLWVTDAAVPAEADLAAPSASVSMDTFVFDRVRIGSGSNIYDIDEIRMGTSMASVLNRDDDPPEPVEGPVIGSGGDSSTLQWNTEVGYRYTVLFTTSLLGELIWTPVPGYENLAWEENTVEGLPHLDEDLIIYAIERVIEPE